MYPITNNHNILLIDNTRITEVELAKQIAFDLYQKNRNPEEWFNYQLILPVTTDVNITGNDIGVIRYYDPMFCYFSLGCWHIRTKNYRYLDGRHFDPRNLYNMITAYYHAFESQLIERPVRFRKRKYPNQRSQKHSYARFRHIHYKNALVALSNPEYKEFNKPIPQYLRSPWCDDFAYRNSAGWKSSSKARHQWAKHKKDGGQKHYKRCINQINENEYSRSCYNCSVYLAYPNDDSSICSWAEWPNGCSNYKE